MMNTSSTSAQHFHPNLLEPLRQWLDHLEIHDRNIAHHIAKLIPAQCPFERDITWFGRATPCGYLEERAHITPLCKLNPLYDQLTTLRFRALCCLAEEWGEDISIYC